MMMMVVRRRRVMMVICAASTAADCRQREERWGRLVQGNPSCEPRLISQGVANETYWNKVFNKGRGLKWGRGETIHSCDGMGKDRQEMCVCMCVNKEEAGFGHGLNRLTKEQDGLAQVAKKLYSTPSFVGILAPSAQHPLRYHLPSADDPRAVCARLDFRRSSLVLGCEALCARPPARRFCGVRHPIQAGHRPQKVQKPLGCPI
mmetsp:Transcript_73787/g.161446  ORF Transcript_73787/g.161446 Transcript_73787/m.161446 type:complete len:204 (+) Transcript_73787:3-614(+)